MRQLVKSKSFVALWKIASLWQIWLVMFLAVIALYLVSNRRFTEQVAEETRDRTAAIEQERVRDDQIACERGIENQERAADKDKREFIGVVTDLINLGDGNLEVITPEEQAEIAKAIPVVSARIDSENGRTALPGVCVTIGVKPPGR